MNSVRRLAGVSAAGLLAAAVPIVAKAQAQTGTVTGRVVDSTSSQGIAGVLVRVEGSLLGTQTRADGGFTIAGVPAGAQTVRAARIGFRPQALPVTVTAGASATVNFALGTVAAQLTEVVAVAYSSGGAQDRRNVTGSVAAVDSSLFNKGRVVSAEDLIQAKVAGVQVVSSNEPGGGITVRVRGQASVNGVNDPLFVVDGIPLPIGGGLSGGRNPLNFLNPQDIANVTVLKDAQATAIYGSRGSNGVVLITTKNGSQGGAQVTYGVNYSNRQVARAPDLLSAEQFRAAVTQYGSTNVGLLNQSNASTDWFDALAQSGGGQEHNLAVGGTRQSLAYRLSLGYLEDEGVLRGDNTNRLSGQFNYSDRLFKDVVDVQATLRAVRTKDVFGGGRFLGDALGFAPTRPVFNSDGTFFATGNVLENRNPLANLALQRSTGRTDRGIGNLQLRSQLPFVRGLSATVRGSFDAARTNQTEFTPTTAPQEAFNQDTLRGRFYQNLPDATTLVLDTYGNYTTRVDRFGGADVDVTAGYSYETFRGNNSSFTARGLTSNAPGVNGLAGAFVRDLPNPNVQIARLASFFGRANFTLADRYLLGLSVRQDASSRFGPNEQRACSRPSPSAGACWRRAS
jgi:iron complex outermembrane receptor protein